jgi:hypothetical protein
MKVAERLALVDRIGRELQSRYSYGEIDNYLVAFGIQPHQQTINSKWVYVKEALAGVDLSVVLRIAHDLDMGGVAAGTVVAPPQRWASTQDFRLFISHISEDKDKATRLRDCLAPYAINGFIAHIDINPTLLWQDEIERGLLTMDALVAVHTPGFSKSHWTQQEIGAAFGRGVKIISLMMGEAPTGLVSKHQALSRARRSAEEIAKEIDSLLGTDETTAARLADARQARGLADKR